MLGLLYADKNTGSYGNVGRKSKIKRGEGTKAGPRAKDEDIEEDENQVELIPESSRDNLYFLDPTTWPLIH